MGNLVNCVVVWLNDAAELADGEMRKQTHD